MKCNKCNKSFGYLAHKLLYNKQICNKCCISARQDANGLFKGCECGTEMSDVINAQSYTFGSRRSSKYYSVWLTEHIRNMRKDKKKG